MNERISTRQYHQSSSHSSYHQLKHAIIYILEVVIIMIPSTDDSIPEDAIGAELDDEIASLQSQS
jgi:hypothetical protein